ncbi:hypothetical protein A9P82_03565 [Arachidicoccus ginsenosidimutans]|nr:hypothetical protein A9P82_03565 [Arachidicoccus sp. BS20]
MEVFKNIHIGYNLNILKRYSDINSLYKGKKIFENIDFWGNILLFVPVPFCLSALFGISKWSTLLLYGFLCSVAIEVVQFIFKIGFADINDVLTNTIGTLLGVLPGILWGKTKQQNKSQNGRNSYN